MSDINDREQREDWKRRANGDVERGPEVDGRREWGMMGNVLANASAIDRSKTDFFPTPPDATHAVLDWLEGNGNIKRGALAWEPACGQGHISEVLAGRGYRHHSRDLHDGSYHSELVDFLDVLPGDAADPDADFIITNPPFKQAAEFIEHASLFDVPVVMLLKSQYWHAASRHQLFKQHTPHAILPLTWRPDFHFGAKGGAPTMEVVWCVWGFVGGPYYRPLERPRVEG